MLLDDLRSLIARHAPDHDVTITDGVRIAGAPEVGAPTISTTGTVFVLMAQGAKRMAVGDQVYDYRAGQSLVASVDLPISGHFTEASRERPALGFALTLRPSAIADLLLHPAAAPFATAPRGTHGRSGIAVHDAPDDLVEAVLRMVRLLDRPRDLPVLAPMVEREILWLLMRGPDGALVRQLGLADSKLSRMGLAVRWIRDNHAVSIRVDELAGMARMSSSAFHRSFQAVTAMSPIQFQKQIRLQEARIRLVADPDDVAGAAYAVGYESPSQFSRDYRRRFGAPPSLDAARLRGEASVDGAAR
jgi:AraC-like DNA-binding protein